MSSAILLLNVLLIYANHEVVDADSLPEANPQVLINTRGVPGDQPPFPHFPNANVLPEMPLEVEEAQRSVTQTPEAFEFSPTPSGKALQLLSTMSQEVEGQDVEFAPTPTGRPEKKKGFSPSTSRNRVLRPFIQRKKKNKGKRPPNRPVEVNEGKKDSPVPTRTPKKRARVGENILKAQRLRKGRVKIKKRPRNRARKDPTVPRVPVTPVSTPGNPITNPPFSGVPVPTLGTPASPLVQRVPIPATPVPTLVNHITNSPLQGVPVPVPVPATPAPTLSTTPLVHARPTPIPDLRTPSVTSLVHPTLATTPVVPVAEARPTLIEPAVAGVVQTPITLKEVGDSLHPHFHYNYGVSDPTTGDQKSHTETRDGDVVKGRYSFVDSDGSIRTVTYTADSVNGFQAVVETTPPSQQRETAPARAVPVEPHAPPPVEDVLPPILAQVPGIVSEQLTEADIRLADLATHTHPLGSHPLLPVHEGHDTPHSHPPFNEHPVIDVETGLVISTSPEHHVPDPPDHHPSHYTPQEHHLPGHPHPGAHHPDLNDQVHHLPGHTHPGSHHPDLNPQVHTHPGNHLTDHHHPDQNRQVHHSPGHPQTGIHPIVHHLPNHYFQSHYFPGRHSPGLHHPVHHLPLPPRSHLNPHVLVKKPDRFPVDLSASAPVYHVSHPDYVKHSTLNYHHHPPVEVRSLEYNKHQRYHGPNYEILIG